MANQLKGQKLEDRALFLVGGEDRRTFLQGLITNDVQKLDKQDLIYACLLTPQGKYLYDFFMFEKEEAIFIDCEASQRDALMKRLMMFKLRSKITFTKEECDVYALWGGGENIDGAQDPRFGDLGHRVYQKPEIDFEQADYKLHRYQCGVPEGQEDIEQNFSTMQEVGLDSLNAIDWGKGCYMGQELTARIHYRGLLKRKLFSLRWEGQRPEKDMNILDEEEHNIGQIRSIYKDRGFALLKLDSEPKGKSYVIGKTILHIL